MKDVLAIIGCTIGGGLAGAVTGFALGLRGGGDFNIAPAIYMPVGACIGGFAGVVIGAVVFARA